LQTCFSYQDAIKHGIRIQETKTKGLGAFAGSSISAGAWVGDYTGEILTNKQVDARYWDKRKKVYADRQWIKSRTKREQGISGDYLFDMGDNLYLDGEDSDVSSWCRFMNHASEDSESRLCNVETKFSRLVQDGNTVIQPRLWFVALRDVESGEELLYDYGGSYWASDEEGR
jgi:SET domain-containing protein